MTEENKTSILNSNEILDIAFENCCRCSLNPDNSPTRKLLMSLLSHRWGTWDLEVVCPKCTGSALYCHLRAQTHFFFFFLLKLCSLQWLVLGSSSSRVLSTHCRVQETWTRATRTVCSCWLENGLQDTSWRTRVCCECQAIELVLFVCLKFCSRLWLGTTK